MEQLKVVKKNLKCHFCGIKKNNYLKYGPTYKLGNFTAHYYCVLLSNKLIQSGKDHEGILGFLLSDIKAELLRTTNILCSYCKRGHATIECSASKCKKQFHLPCGLKKGSSHQFMCQFKSFCHLHRLVQQIPQKVLQEACENEVICCICQEKVDVESRSGDTLWAPCCRKTWYHRYCLQKFAHSAGYFCRCPACNDSKKFNQWIQHFGIFIPQQDASWELDPNAFDELLFRYNSCDAEECKCPGGRQSSKENTIWEIILCDSCGSQGVHVACGNLKFVEPEWECGLCSQITQKVKSPVTEVSGSCVTDVGSSKPETGQKKRRRNSEDLENSVLDKRKRRRTIVEEEADFEIDVETVDDETKHETSTGGHDEAKSEGGKGFVSPVPLPRSSEPGANSEKEKTRDLGRLAHGRAEEPAAATTKRTGLDEVLSLLKPGPLSYKLAKIRNMLGDFTVPKTTRENQKKKDKTAAESSSSTVVIELSDSEEDSDVEIIDEVSEKTSAEEHSKSILHYRVRKDQGDVAEERQWQQKAPEEEGLNQRFSLQDFEVIAIVSLQPAEFAKDAKAPMNGANEKAAAMKYFPGQSPGNNCQSLTAAREDKEPVQAADDDVVILTD